MTQSRNDTSEARERHRNFGDQLENRLTFQV